MILIKINHLQIETIKMESKQILQPIGSLKNKRKVKFDKKYTQADSDSDSDSEIHIKVSDIKKGKD